MWINFRIRTPACGRCTLLSVVNVEVRFNWSSCSYCRWRTFKLKRLKWPHYMNASSATCCSRIWLNFYVSLSISKRKVYVIEPSGVLYWSCSLIVIALGTQCLWLVISIVVKLCVIVIDECTVGLNFLRVSWRRCSAEQFALYLIIPGSNQKCRIWMTVCIQSVHCCKTVM